MNKRILSLCVLAGVSLLSCADTNALYPDGAYTSGTFVEHVYDVWEGKTKEGYQNLAQAKVLQNEEHGYFCGSGQYDNMNQLYGYGQARSWHPDWFKNDQGGDLYWGFRDAWSDINDGTPGKWTDNSSLNGVIYSQTKRLDRPYPKFSNGYLSKLYNGQIKCNGWSYLAMVLASESGFGTLFPYELVNAEYFAMPVLIGTDYEGAGNDRIVTSDIHVTFYKYGATSDILVGYKVSMEEVKLDCNHGSAYTSLLGFTFADAGIDPKGIVGMSITWDLLYDPLVDSGDFSTEGYHDGLCVYEVLIPDSTWY